MEGESRGAQRELGNLQRLARCSTSRRLGDGRRATGDLRSYRPRAPSCKLGGCFNACAPACDPRGCHHARVPKPTESY